MNFLKKIFGHKIELSNLNQSNASNNIPFNENELTIEENQLCNELNYNYNDALFLKNKAKNIIEKFKFDNSQLAIDSPECIYANCEINLAYEIIRENQTNFIKQNKFIFLGDWNKPFCKLVITNHTNNPYKIMEYAETNGSNYDIETIDVIKKIKDWDSRLGIIFYGIGFDFLQLRIKNVSIDIEKLVIEINEFCPDAESTDYLEDELKNKSEILLWWD